MKPTTKNLLTMENASHYIDNFDRFRMQYDNTDYQPVESFQFSIEAMECYIHYVKCLSQLKGVEVTGIRVVNAIYPSDKGDKDVRHQHTVLFIPTYKNRKGEDEAFDPLYIEDGVPVSLSQLLKDTEGHSPEGDQKDIKGKSSKMLFSTQESSQPSSFLNFGKMGKPPVKD